MKDSVLMVEASMGTGLRQADLERLGFEVWLCPDIDSAEAEIERIVPDVCILTAQSTRQIAWDRVRTAGIDLPLPWILILEEWTTDQLASAFAAGIHEVLQWSIPSEELGIRLRSWIHLFRRFADGNKSELNYEDLKMDLRGRKVYRGSDIIKLTTKEFELLRFLLKRAEQVCPRELILQEVWGYDFSTGTNVVDVYIRHLRKKIDKGQKRKLIHTVRGAGYMVQ